MKKWIALLCAVMMAALPLFALAEEEEDDYVEENNLFEIRKLILDENKKVTAVVGVYEEIIEDEEGMDAPSYGTEEFTYPLAAGYKYIAPVDPDDLMSETKEYDDLYQWYVQTYLNGEEPANGLTFLMDVPEADRQNTSVDFWFITAQIELNDAGEIVTMTDFYVPWN